MTSYYISLFIQEISRVRSLVSYYILRFFSWYPALLIGILFWFVFFCIIGPKGTVFIPNPYVSYSIFGFTLLLLIGYIFFLFQRRRKKLSPEGKVVFQALGVALLLLVPSSISKWYEGIRLIQKQEILISCGQIKALVKATVQSRTLVELYGKPMWSITVMFDEIKPYKENDESRFISTILQTKTVRLKVAPPSPILSGDIFECDSTIKLEQSLGEPSIWKINLKPDWSSLKNVSSNSYLKYMGETKLSLDAFFQQKAFELYPENSRIREVLLALLFGFPLEKEIRADIHRVGVDHLFAISGFHFSCLVSCVTALLFALSRRARTFSALVLSFLFLFIVGLEAPSVLRAWWTIFIASIGILVGRRAEALNSLGIALSIIVFLDPTIVLSIGFQLSFLATWGLLLYSGPCTACITGYLFKKRIKRSDIEEMSFVDQISYMVLQIVAKMGSVAIAVWLFIVPYAFCFLDGFTLLGVFYNLLLPPIFSFALIFGILSLAFISFFQIGAFILARTASTCVSMGLSLIDATESTMFFMPYFLQSLLMCYSFFYIAFPLFSLIGIIAHVFWKECKYGNYEYSNIA